MAEIIGGFYHLLCRPFGQRVSIAQVVNFNILDVVSIGDVDLAIKLARTLSRRGGRGLHRRCR